jgi:hypothetical protein
MFVTHSSVKNTFGKEHVRLDVLRGFRINHLMRVQPYAVKGMESSSRIRKYHNNGRQNVSQLASNRKKLTLVMLTKTLTEKKHQAFNTIIVYFKIIIFH